MIANRHNAFQILMFLIFGLLITLEWIRTQSKGNAYEMDYESQLQDLKEQTNNLILKSQRLEKETREIEALHEELMSDAERAKYRRRLEDIPKK